mmetsp:Transcript_31719/g.72853  ORF Transcript_31719/g.72853 Transcript_31719/m.72853 type:complete len:202 (-) Transcript_31719:251-856(-)
MPVGTERNTFKQPTTLAERLVMADVHIKRTGFDWPCLVDPPLPDGKDAFLSLYAPWPERFYVLAPQDDGFVLQYIGSPDANSGHSIDEVRSFLVERRGRPQRTLSEEEREDESIRRLVSCMFGTFTDADYDGRIQVQRLAELQATANLPRLDAALSEADRDLDGQVTFKALHRQIRRLGRDGKRALLLELQQAAPESPAAA